MSQHIFLIEFCRECSLHQQTVHHTQGAAASAWRVWSVLPCLPGSMSSPGRPLRHHSLNSRSWVQGKVLQDVWRRPFGGECSGVCTIKYGKGFRTNSSDISFISNCVYNRRCKMQIHEIILRFSNGLSPPAIPYNSRSVCDSTMPTPSPTIPAAATKAHWEPGEEQVPTAGWDEGLLLGNLCGWKAKVLTHILFKSKSFKYMISSFLSCLENAFLRPKTIYCMSA